MPDGVDINADNASFVVAAFYNFTALPDFEVYQEPLQTLCRSHGRPMEPCSLLTRVSTAPLPVHVMALMQP